MKAYIVLENGDIFEGERFGAPGDATGELVFTTGMGGYIETLTDPSYYGHIIMQTFPEIGNYGVIGEDFESGGCAAKAYVVSEICGHPSNFRAEKTVDEFLKSEGVPGVFGVDTRGLTRIIRENGVMNAKITSDPDKVDLSEIRVYRIMGAVAAVSAKAETVLPAAAEKKYAVALLDYGAKRNIVRELQKRGCEVTVLPCGTPAGRILSGGFDGLMLSNGPGDPADNVRCVKELKYLLGKLPIFGICLGHQLLALAAGGRTEKLKYGHRGVNQPVRELETGRVYITSQNHGYTVVPDGLEAAGGRVSYVNANDGTVEGVDYPGSNAFSVQFHPEGCSGPKDSEHLFDKFIGRMRAK